MIWVDQSLCARFFQYTGHSRCLPLVLIAILWTAAGLAAIYFQQRCSNLIGIFGLASSGAVAYNLFNALPAKIKI